MHSPDHASPSMVVPASPGAEIHCHAFLPASGQLPLLSLDQSLPFSPHPNPCAGHPALHVLSCSVAEFREHPRANPNSQFPELIVSESHSMWQTCHSRLPLKQHLFIQEGEKERQSSHPLGLFLHTYSRQDHLGLEPGAGNSNQVLPVGIGDLSCDKVHQTKSCH